MIDWLTGTAAGSAVVELPGASESSTDKLTADADCYALVLQFYDGLCLWEEGSSTPVLHITWAQHALYSLGRFDFRARAGLMLTNAAPVGQDDDTRSDDSVVSSNSAKLKRMSDSGLQRSSHRARGRPPKTVMSPASTADDGSPDADAGNTISNAGSPDTNGGNPDTNTGQAAGPDMSPVVESAENKCNDEQTASEKSPSATEDVSEAQATSAGAPVAISASLMLRSVKMMGMKDLLVAERLNAGAIKLQLTAQSQVHLKHSRTSAPAADYATSDVTPSSVSRKRIRRE